MSTSNPAFSKETFAGFEQVYGANRAAAMTVQGTIGKTFALLGILSATGLWAWNATQNQHLSMAVLPAAGIGGMILALITIFKPTVAPWTAPVYAAFEGVFLGSLSCLIEASVQQKFGPQQYPGIALQAVSLTCGTLFVMLFAYTTGLIQVTQRLRAGVVAATGAIALVYGVAMIASLFGARVPFLYDASPIGIGISLVVVGVAAFNLLLDFDFIEYGARMEAPKYMEWYAAFGLILTLVWLYLEFLRLLRKLQDRR
ncbi:Bax inhibitor-1/YccA family protein [Singulisphaera acidiphila]|uniref:Putative membrane protein n=1 Tax=Singulisphaera acidiphila (strain ATCC BAA-1392 / DSM 18658 / VKM B-2454 / MOB10) TaxID=886293 RepID=L0D6N3_SINAD|nr:Bax inhibitor-1/YccA family protein [Singulisphaera acidiphila]AGA25069.1 putative membrane protein [Singulisphaera acidiphila DSM 18658]